MIFCSRSQPKMFFSFKTFRCRSDRAPAWRWRLHSRAGDLRNQHCDPWWQGRGVVIPFSVPWVNLHFQCALNSFTGLHLSHKIPQPPFRTFSSGASLSKDSFESVADPTDVYVRIFHSSTSDCAVSGDDMEPHILPCCLERYISIYAEVQKAKFPLRQCSLK